MKIAIVIDEIHRKCIRRASIVRVSRQVSISVACALFCILNISAMNDNFSTLKITVCTTHIVLFIDKFSFKNTQKKYSSSFDQKYLPYPNPGDIP